MANAALQQQFPSTIETACVIDDDPDMRFCIGRILGKCGLNVSNASTGEDAIRLLNDSPADVVFCDLRLGNGFDGETTMQAIMKMHPDTKVVAMSSAMSPEQRQALLGIGIDECFRKPFFKDECLALLASWTAN